MKKIIIIGILIFVFTLLFNSYPKSNYLKSESTLSSKYSYYKEELKERYDKYQKRYPSLDYSDVITRVNLNLDLDFYTNTKEAPYLNSNLIFVNKYYYLNNDYVPNDLEDITDCVNGNRKLVKDANEDFSNLCKDIKADNLNLRVISSYRSYDYQKTLYDNYVLKDGKEKADTYSARPGFSEHQTGLVIDVDNGKTNYEEFENTDEFKWMMNNAHKYGFILRYPNGKEDITGYTYESWHYRYVGIEVATFIYENGITFDEYIAKMKNSQL